MRTSNRDFLTGCGCLFVGGVAGWAVVIVAVVWIVSFALKHNPF